MFIIGYPVILLEICAFLYNRIIGNFIYVNRANFYEFTLAKRFPLVELLYSNNKMLIINNIMRLRVRSEVAKNMILAMIVFGIFINILTLCLILYYGYAVLLMYRFKKTVQIRTVRWISSLQDQSLSGVRPLCQFFEGSFTMERFRSIFSNFLRKFQF